jgi:hypothetical protein
MGLSFHDEPSLVEAASSLNGGRSPYMGPDDDSDSESNAIQIMVNIDQEKRDDDTGRSDNVKMVDSR